MEKELVLIPDALVILTALVRVRRIIPSIDNIHRRDLMARSFYLPGITKRAEGDRKKR